MAAVVPRSRVRSVPSAVLLPRAIARDVCPRTPFARTTTAVLLSLDPGKNEGECVWHVKTRIVFGGGASIFLGWISLWCYQQQLENGTQKKRASWLFWFPNILFCIVGLSWNHSQRVICFLIL